MSLARVSRAKKGSPARPPWAETLGRRLRDRRTERGLTLAAVSSATGISTSFLSLLEAGRTDVSLGRLLPLMELYGQSMAALLSWNTSAEEGVVRSGDAPRMLSVAKGIDLFLAAPDHHRPFLPMIAEYQPGSKMRTYSEHEGDEFLYMLEGRLRIDFRGEEAVALMAGDAIFFSGRRPHRFVGDGDVLARALIVTTERIPR